MASTDISRPWLTSAILAGSTARMLNMNGKLRYKVRNWHEYNRALVNRGNVTLWFDDESVKSWHWHGVATKRGRPCLYAMAAIECALTIRSVFHLPLRMTQGFLVGMIKMLSLPISAPDYSTLCRRAGGVAAQLTAVKPGQGIHLVVDSTGLKVFGEGEWKVRQHGWDKRRTWRKFHVGIDSETHEIVAFALTENDVHDSEVLPELINGRKDLAAVYGDGAYDTKGSYDAIAAIGAQGFIPPRHGACLTNGNKVTWGTVRRNQIIRDIWKLGRKTWKEGSGYHRRSLVETGMFRFKTVFGDHIRSRKMSHQQAEVAIKVRVLNKMTRLGMPDSSPIY
jgi:Transposase DDE domain